LIRAISISVASLLPPATASLLSHESVAPLFFLSYMFIPLSAIAFPHIGIFCLTARRMKQFKHTMIFYPLCILAVWVPSVYLGVAANAARDIPAIEAKLEEKGLNSDETWSSIVANEGSVQHLDCLSDLEKDVFKTAFELDQRWLIDLAADRAPFVCQSQSLNVFLPADVHKRDLHQIHFQAWKKGVKTLYYCRSKSISRSESVASDGKTASVPLLGRVNGGEQPAGNDYEECLSCQ